MPTTYTPGIPEPGVNPHLSRKVFTMKFFTLPLAVLLLCAVAHAQAGTIHTKRTVTITLKNGDSVTGTLAQINSDEAQVDVGDAYKTVKLDDVRRIEFGGSTTSATARPTPSPEPYEAAGVDALQALRRLMSATEVGITLAQYNQLVVEVYERVSEDLTSIPEGDLRSEIASAMDDYAFARDWWSASLNYDDGAIPTKSDIARRFNARYNMGIKPKYGDSLRQKETLDYIWQSAARHMVAALKLIQ
jgi:hypothetical protein